MLKQRIIPSLLLKDGRMVKGKKFTDFRDVGDPVTAAKVYNAQKVDELMFLDIRSTPQSREMVRKIIQAAACECFMPLTVGGGVRTVEDVRYLLTTISSGTNTSSRNTSLNSESPVISLNGRISIPGVFMSTRK